MIRRGDRTERRPRRSRTTAVTLGVLAAVVYVPLLLTGRGRVVADADGGLLVDPGRLLARVVTMWDQHTGLGAVPRMQMGNLWPVGPYYWVADQFGVPDWVAQRVWLGSILLVAGAGVVFLARTWRWRPEGGAAAAFVYALSPYVASLATRNSTALLAFAGLPWLLALTIRSLRTPGWRHPALFALVVATVGASDPAALLLVLVAPVGWILYALARVPEVTRTAAAWSAAKLGLVSLAVNLWWILALSVEATNGLPARPYDRTPEVTASTSTAPEVLRGLGDWSFYAGDRLGPLLPSSVEYTQSIWLLVLTFGIVTTGLLGLGIARWRHRVFAIGMLVVGAVLAVGAHPWTEPSPIGALIKAAASTDVALRDPTRAVPLVALAVAVGIGALVGASLEESWRRGLGATAVAVTVAIAALPPLWLGQFVPADLDRPEEIPDYWQALASRVDDGDDGTRVLEIPGADESFYRWGHTDGPVTADLVDRPHATRERLPTGSAPSADLLRALDLRLQEGTLEPDALAIVARMMNVGDLVVRSDLQHERYDTARPRTVWDLVTAAEGLGVAEPFGPRTPNDPDGDAPRVDEDHLVADRDLPNPPATAVVPVLDPVPIVHAHGSDRMVILSGDGFGIVDAAAAGLLEGDELVRYSANVTDDPDFVRTGLVDERALIVTDSNRARAERWTTLRENLGFTEQPDGGLLGSDPADRRLPLFDVRPGIRTVAEHVGIAARATGYGGPAEYEPAVRPVNAVDGDPTTVWRVGEGGDPEGARIELSSDAAIETDTIRIVQAPDDGRWIDAIAIRFDEGDSVRVALDERSRRPDGQAIEIEQRPFESLSIEIVGVSTAPDVAARLGGVGFAEIDLGVAPTREYLRMPQDLLDNAGFRSLRYPLALVQTRLRAARTDTGREDEEQSLARVLDLPAARSYRLTGTVRLSADAPTTVLDLLTGRNRTPEAITTTATSTIPGGLDHLPSNVLDDDPTTRWTSAFGATAGQSITLASEAPRPVPAVAVTFVDDAAHSVPEAIVVIADGVEVGRAPVPPGPTGLRTVEVPVDVPGSAADVTVSFPTVAERGAPADGAARTLPLAVTSIAIDGWVVDPRPASLDTGCRADLVMVDGVGLPVRVTGDMASALRGEGLDLLACNDEAVTLPGGDRRFDSADGRATGLDVDRLVWCSVEGGAACGAVGPLLDAESAAPSVDVIDSDDATVRVQVSGARPGQPFWIVLGQSFEPGWSIIDSDVESESTQLVDGFANGFLVEPDREDFEVTMRFVPQNRVEIGLLLSVVGIVLALGLAVGSGSPGRPVPIPLQEPLRRIRALTWEGGLPTRRDAASVGVAAWILATLVIGPAFGLAIGLVAGLATRQEGWRGAFTLLPAGLAALCGISVIAYQVQDEVAPGMHWPAETGRFHQVALAAVVLLVVDVVIDAIWARRSDFR